MPQLKPKELKAELSSKKLRPAYYWAGEDLYEKKEALKILLEISKAGEWGLQEIAGGDLTSARDLPSIFTPSLFASRSLVLVRSAESIPAGLRQVLAGHLPDLAQTHCWVFLAEERKADRSDVLTAQVENLGAVVVFWLPREPELKSWIRDFARRRGFSLGEKEVGLLLEAVGPDRVLLSQEMEKAFLYRHGSRSIGLDDLKSCLAGLAPANIFDWQRHLWTKDGRRAVEHLHRLWQEGTPWPLLLSQIASALRRQRQACLLLESGASEDEVFDRLKINRYYNPEFVRWAGLRKSVELERSLLGCLKTEVRLKTGSATSDLGELENLVLGACA